MGELHSHSLVFTAERTWGEKEQNENTVKPSKEKTAPYKTQRMLQDT